MAQVISTNSLSLITQNNINKNQSALATSIERLSSGLRINSAKDDAAGQAIANRFTSNIKGLTQAARNANDGISVAQTTEGALSEINNNLQRVRELTVQATTGTNSSSDLDSIQDEIKSRLDEIDRVSGQTQFNGVNVLAKDGTMKIQVGANDGETISIDLKKIDSSTLGLSTFNVNGAGSVANTAASKDDLELAKTAVTTANGVSTYTVSANLKNATGADVLSNLANGDTVTSTATLTNGFAADTDSYEYNKASNTFSYDSTSAATNTAAMVQSYLTPKSGETAKLSVEIGGSKQDVLLSSDGKITAEDGSKIYIDTTGNLTKNGSLTPGTQEATLDLLAINRNSNGTPAAVETKITAADGAVITLAGSTTATAGNIGVSGAKVSAADLKTASSATGFTTGTTAVAINGDVTVGGLAAYKADDSTLTTDNTTKLFLQTDGSVTNGSGKSVFKDADGKFTTDATTKAASTADPLKALDAAISQIDKFRSSLGAVQNRLASAVTNLNNTTTNLSEAQSRIQDADYATEVSNMSKAQIIQQAGNSVLAKANQVPQQVLSLLQG